MIQSHDLLFFPWLRLLPCLNPSALQGEVKPDDLHFTKGRKYTGWGAYGQSKLGDMLLARSVADKTKGTPTTGAALRHVQSTSTGMWSRHSLR